MTTMVHEEREIRAAARPHCALCGGTGDHIHRELRDRLFGAPDSWSLKKCSNRQCGLVWLDPMPLTEDIGKAYASYYTHAAIDTGIKPGLVKSVYQWLKRGYLASRYGYASSHSALSRLFCRLIYFFMPLRRLEVNASVRFLPFVNQGRVLDVGCGAGEWLGIMRNLGWQVEGVDFDENAVRVAREAGLSVRCGSVEQQQYPSESFDAITLNHVIEHVPDPVATLKECARLLKKGGKLVLVTPNQDSLSHRVFGKDWRGLEPPRHLHIFSPSSLRQALGLAGLRDVDVRPIIAYSVIYESTLLRRGVTGPAATTRGNRSADLRARLFNFAELFVIPFNPAAADCVATVATKT